MNPQEIRPGPMSFQDWRRKFSVITPGAKEIISHMFRFVRPYTDATTTELVFFNDTADGQTAVAATGPTRGYWPGPNGLNNGESFLVQAIGCSIQLAATEDAAAAATASLLAGAIRDMSELIYTGYAEFKIGGKDYGSWPIYKLQAGGGPYARLASVGTTTAGQNITNQHAINGVPDVRCVYTLPIPLAVPPLFGVRGFLKWPTAVNLAPDQSPAIEWWMDGQLMRPIQ